MQPLGIPEWLLSITLGVSIRNKPASGGAKLWRTLLPYRQSAALPSPPNAPTESLTLLAEGSPMFQSDKQKRSDCRTATISQSVGKKEMKVTEKKEMENRKGRRNVGFSRGSLTLLYTLEKGKTKKLYKLYTKPYTDSTFY